MSMDINSVEFQTIRSQPIKIERPIHTSVRRDAYIAIKFIEMHTRSSEHISGRIIGTSQDTKSSVGQQFLQQFLIDNFLIPLLFHFGRVAVNIAHEVLPSSVRAEKESQIACVDEASHRIGSQLKAGMKVFCLERLFFGFYLYTSHRSFNAVMLFHIRLGMSFKMKRRSTLFFSNPNSQQVETLQIGCKVGTNTAWVQQCSESCVKTSHIIVYIQIGDGVTFFDVGEQINTTISTMAVFQPKQLTF